MAVVICGHCGGSLSGYRDSSTGEQLIDGHSDDCPDINQIKIPSSKKTTSDLESYLRRAMTGEWFKVIRGK